MRALGATIIHRGLFADLLVTRFSLLPVEEEGRLNDPRLRENFVERIFAYRRLTALFAARWSMGTVVRFHTAHKLTGGVSTELVRPRQAVRRAA